MSPKRKHTPEPAQGVVDLTSSPTRNIPLPVPLTSRTPQPRSASRGSSRSHSNNSRHSSVSGTMTTTAPSNGEIGSSSRRDLKRRKIEMTNSMRSTEKGKGKAREIDVEDEVDELDSESEVTSHASSRAAAKGKAKEVYPEEEIDELESELDELESDSGGDTNSYGYDNSGSSSTIMSMMNGGSGLIHPAVTDSQPSSFSSHTAELSNHGEIIFPNPPSAEPSLSGMPAAILIPPDEPKPSSSHQAFIPAQAPPPPPPPEPEPLSSYTCPICFSPPTNATLTPCGHICCGQCLFTAVKTTMTRGMWVGEGSAK
jgi:hypothetical protein